MLFKIRVSKIVNGSRKWIYSKEVTAESAIQAFEKACVKMTPDRIIEIRQIQPFERPPVNRADRNGAL